MRPHAAHGREFRNRRPSVRPIHARPDPIRWSESGRTPLLAGGQSRTAADLSATARDLYVLLLAGAALAGLTYGLGWAVRVML